MSSRREEERNEKIIRGLMKLPPNRRCINCNSLGPQYVCTNFWTFVCTTCSGIHREFTHRVKSVSMAKFTSQEVDFLQKGGNQRARELYLKTWDPQSRRLPDNSNADKVREFIKNVYVNRKYALENSSDRPPRDPQGERNHEDDKRRASSYHSYSQSPPYDFEYEERRYGKHAPTLTRKPGSDRGLYGEKLSSFSSPSRFSDQANDDQFGNEGSYPRASDFSVSSGRDPIKSDVLSPSSHRDRGSPCSSKSNGGRTLHSQRTASSGSFGSFDGNSLSFKSVTSTGFLEAASPEPEPHAEIYDKSSSISSPVQPVQSWTFGGLELFDAPFAPQNATSTTPPTGSSSQFQGSLLTQPVELFQQQSNRSTFTEQQPSQVQQPSLLDLFSHLMQQQPRESSSEKISDGVMPNDGGWASFDMAQNSVPGDIESSAPAAVPASHPNITGSFNPFSFDQSSDSAGHEPAAAFSSSFWHEGLQNVETTASTAPLWNAFEDSTERRPIPNVLQNHEQANEHSDSNGDKSFGISVSEGLYDDRNVRSPLENETSAFGLTLHTNSALQDFSMVSAVTGSRAIATDYIPSNPFDLPDDSDMESGNMPQFWDMSYLQAALPNTQKLPSYAGDVNQSWFPQNPVQPFIPDEVALDHPSANIMTIPAQGPVIGGNPFA